MFVKLVRVEMTVDSSSYENAPNNSGRTFRKIILSIGAQRSLLKPVQFVHDVTIDLCMLSPLSSAVDLPRLTRPSLSFGTHSNSARVPASSILPKMKRAELRILRSDSEACSRILGLTDMSRQYSTVAAHRRSVSAPYAGCFLP